MAKVRTFMVTMQGEQKATRLLRGTQKDVELKLLAELDIKPADDLALVALGKDGVVIEEATRG